jgi:hypothetical protein
MADTHKLWSFKGRGETPRRNERFVPAVPAGRTEVAGVGKGRPRGSAMEELDRRARAAADTQVPGEQLGENTLLELIGSLDRVPYLAVDATRLLDLKVDHRTGFLLSEIDGRLDLETIVDVSGMPRLDTLRILYRLLEDGIVRVG